MGEANRRVVLQRPDGRHEIRAPGADRAGAVTATQDDDVGRPRTVLGSDGGSRLQVLGRDGTARRQDTVARSDHPRDTRRPPR